MPRTRKPAAAMTADQLRKVGNLYAQLCQTLGIPINNFDNSKTKLAMLNAAYQLKYDSAEFRAGGFEDHCSIVVQAMRAADEAAAAGKAEKK